MGRENTYDTGTEKSDGKEGKLREMGGVGVGEWTE